MKKTIAIAVLIAAFAGCKTAEQKDGEPIVSPAVISTDKAESGEPQLPNHTPWWKSQQ